ncbi:MAG: response regulator [Gammaproteobacteria bacterium]|nr:response regulator [Gammaproteobacteria bacterium]
MPNVAKRLALVVDDSLTARRSAAAVMRNAGFEVRMALDGLEAVALLEKLVPDIILSDLEMPRMNGLEFIAHVRARPSTRTVPIIMITSRSTDKHRQQATAAGVNTYLTKPFNAFRRLPSTRLHGSGRVASHGAGSPRRCHGLRHQRAAHGGLSWLAGPGDDACRGAIKQREERSWLRRARGYCNSARTTAPRLGDANCCIWWMRWNRSRFPWRPLIAVRCCTGRIDPCRSWTWPCGCAPMRGRTRENMSASSATS